MYFKIGKIAGLMTILLICIFSTSCNKVGVFSDVDTIEELRQIMTSCNVLEIDSVEDIKDHLIGEWQLIGVESGFTGTLKKADVTVHINSETIVYHDHNTEEIIETNWSLEQINTSNMSIIYILVDESSLLEKLGMETFCEDYMYGNGRLRDADISVYAKVD